MKRRKRRAPTQPSAESRDGSRYAFALLRLRLPAILLLALLAASCTAPPAQAPQRTGAAVQTLAPGEVVTQRGLLTAHGRQFPLNGYVTKSRAGVLTLVLTDNFGGAKASVQVDAGGKVKVLQAEPPFRPSWVERYVAADLKCIFEAPDANCQVQMLGPTHFIIKRRWYELDLRTVETKMDEHAGDGGKL